MIAAKRETATLNIIHGVLHEQFTVDRVDIATNLEFQTIECMVEDMSWEMNCGCGKRHKWRKSKDGIMNCVTKLVEEEVDDYCYECGAVHGTKTKNYSIYVCRCCDEQITPGWTRGEQLVPGIQTDTHSFDVIDDLDRFQDIVNEMYGDDLSDIDFFKFEFEYKTLQIVGEMMITSMRHHDDGMLPVIHVESRIRKSEKLSK